MKILSMICLMLPLSAFSQDYQVEYSRTYNKVMADNNALHLSINAQGELVVTLPSFAPIQSSKTQFQMKSSVHNLQQNINDLLRHKTNSNINRKLAVIKSDRNKPLFYSSEVDQFNLTISLADKVIWQHEFYNWEELKYHYEQLGEWQPLVDVVTQIHTELANINNAQHQEQGHE